MVVARIGQPQTGLSHRRVGASGDNGHTLLTLDFPVGLANGDLVIAILSTSLYMPDIDAPPGWLVAENRQSTISTRSSLAILSKRYDTRPRAQGGDGPDATFELACGVMVGTIIAANGERPANPVQLPVFGGDMRPGGTDGFTITVPDSFIDPDLPTSPPGANRVFIDSTGATDTTLALQRWVGLKRSQGGPGSGTGHDNWVRIKFKRRGVYWCDIPQGLVGNWRRVDLNGATIVSKSRFDPRHPALDDFTVSMTQGDNLVTTTDGAFQQHVDGTFNMVGWIVPLVQGAGNEGGDGQSLVSHDSNPTRLAVILDANRARLRRADGTDVNAVRNVTNTGMQYQDPIAIEEANKRTHFTMSNKDGYRVFNGTIAGSRRDGRDYIPYSDPQIGIRIVGSHNVELGPNLTIHNTYSDAFDFQSIQTAPGEYRRNDRVWVHDCNFYETGRMGFSRNEGFRSIVERCRVADSARSLMDFEPGPGDPPDHSQDHNTIYNAFGVHGLQLAAGRSAVTDGEKSGTGRATQGSNRFRLDEGGQNFTGSDEKYHAHCVITQGAHRWETRIMGRLPDDPTTPLDEESHIAIMETVAPFDFTAGTAITWTIHSFTGCASPWFFRLSNNRQFGPSGLAITMSGQPTDDDTLWRGDPTSLGLTDWTADGLGSIETTNAGGAKAVNTGPSLSGPWTARLRITAPAPTSSGNDARAAAGISPTAGTTDGYAGILAGQETEFLGGRAGRAISLPLSHGTPGDVTDWDPVVNALTNMFGTGGELRPLRTRDPFYIAGHFPLVVGLNNANLPADNVDGTANAAFGDVRAAAYDRLIAGEFDGDLDRCAQAAAAMFNLPDCTATYVMRIGHEYASEGYDWSIRNFRDDANWNRFRAAWRRVAGIFRNRFTRGNLMFAYCGNNAVMNVVRYRDGSYDTQPDPNVPNNSTGIDDGSSQNGRSYFTRAYPGDDVVDIITVDTYLRHSFDWHKLNRVSLRFAEAHGKAFAVDEWGVFMPHVPGTPDSDPDDDKENGYGDDPAIVDGLFDQINNTTTVDVLYHCYFNADEDCNLNRVYQATPGRNGQRTYPTVRQHYINLYG